MKVTANTIVSLPYIMKNYEGIVLEDTMSGESINYLHGSGNILPELEASLEGMEKGDQRSISISNETISQLTEQFHFDVIIDAVRPATEEELKKGKSLQTSNSCGPDCCC